MIILAHNAKLVSIMAGIQLEATVLSHSKNREDSYGFCCQLVSPITLLKTSHQRTVAPTVGRSLT